jgi:(1->4)-alpha-D-glucan 1-alpha-D-glucosylmutase
VTDGSIAADGPSAAALAAAGIAPEYEDVWGTRHRAPPAALAELLARFGTGSGAATGLPPTLVIRAGQPLVAPLPAGARAWRLVEEAGAVHRIPVDAGADDPAGVTVLAELPLGRHRLEAVDGDRVIAAATVVVHPGRCHRPGFLDEGARPWGVSAQLYALATDRTWGVGDFGALRALLDAGGAAGADVVGLNPLHALFGANPAHDSPYSPSSREHLNPIYLDVEALPEYAECPAARALREQDAFARQLAALRALPLVDYPGVWSAKRAVLALLHAHFRARHEPAESAHAAAFARFVRERGQPLLRFAAFEAIDAHLRATGEGGHGWRSWPVAWHDPGGASVRAFVQGEGEDAVHFHLWLQWHADRQLAAAAAHARRVGMRIGLYLDLAVGVDPSGADAWSDRAMLADGVAVGAPPDELQRDGQNWGLPPPCPHRLEAAGFAPFVRALRANMRHAGALRIDHVMALHRLFVIPAGRSAREGAYVRYPLEAAMGVLALESERNRCIVIGEDLGTVPPEVRTAMETFGLLSYRPLLFAKDVDGAFVPPEAYPRNALVAATTHDLPTLAGFWVGHDLALRTAMGLFDDARVREALMASRAQDRTRLLLALDRARLLPPGVGADPLQIPEMSTALAAAVHAFLARTPSALLMVQPEDLLGIVDQTNIPGSLSPAHPNWQRRLPLPVAEWFADARARAIVDAIRAERPRTGPRRDAAATYRIPRATYRLQFNRHFTFRDALAIVPYLARLGVSHVYASPFLKARPGSLHGYDIVDHAAINPEIGTREELEALADLLREHDMGLVADIVPNHMGVTGNDNAWWLDVLENGETALHAPFFDVDWRPAKPELRGKVLLPLLGGPYGDVLERGELVLGFDAESGSFAVAYFNHRLPIDPRSTAVLLTEARGRVDAASDTALELDGLARLFANLPRPDPADADAVLAAHRERALYKRRLAKLVRDVPEAGSAIAASVDDWNGDPVRPESFDRLHALLEVQHYRLSDWHAASDEINYRRFFDINELAALRMEDPRVFDATHGLVLELCASGVLDGLRVDHPDGLHDPEAYFRHLQRRVAEARGAPVDAAGRATWLVVEKILAPHEGMPASWPVHGTTGYEFMNLVNGLFVDPAAAPVLERFHAAFTGRRESFDTVLHTAKRLVMKRALASELTVLANRLNRISEADRHTRDFTLNRLRQALTEVVAWFPVYRTYVREGTVAESDRRHIEWALGRARRSAGDATAASDAALFAFIERALTLGLPSDGAGADAAENQRFAMRFQQFTAPVTAKSFEDTALYRYLPLASLNEVGGDPRRFAVSVEAFHQENAARARQWPHALLATSTHDNKRGEDVRARIDVLSELAGEWVERVRRWSRIARSRRTRLASGEAPSRTDEYLFFQTLVGVWPVASPDATAHDALVDRLCAYMLKAAREAKVHTSWTAPDAQYEAALDAFVRGLLARDGRNLFREDFEPFVREVAVAGASNSLAQTLLKLTAPGLPDLYQGTEAWDDSLVDPDNRRPVSFDGLRRDLEALAAVDSPEAVAPLFAAPGEHRAKLFVVERALAARREHEALFTHGDYLPLATTGVHAAHLCAFARRHAGRWAIVVVPRLVVKLPRVDGRIDWGDTAVALPEGAPATLTDRFTGAAVDATPAALSAARLLAACPVGLVAG